MSSINFCRCWKCSGGLYIPLFHIRALHIPADRHRVYIASKVYNIRGNDQKFSRKRIAISITYKSGHRQGMVYKIY